MLSIPARGDWQTYLRQEKFGRLNTLSRYIFAWIGVFVFFYSFIAYIIFINDGDSRTDRLYSSAAPYLAVLFFIANYVIQMVDINRFIRSRAEEKKLDRP